MGGAPPGQCTPTYAFCLEACGELLAGQDQWSHVLVPKFLAVTLSVAMLPADRPRIGSAPTGAKLETDHASVVGATSEGRGVDGIMGAMGWETLKLGMCESSSAAGSDPRATTLGVPRPGKGGGGGGGGG